MTGVGEAKNYTVCVYINIVYTVIMKRTKLQYFKWFGIGLALSVFGVTTLLQRPVQAAQFLTIANCFRPGLGLT